MTKPVKIKDALGGLFKSLKIDKRVREAGAAHVWAEIVGDDIDRVTQVAGVENGLLKVIVRDSVWRQELVMMKWEIIRKLNERLGEKIITDIRFR
ncbi:MAG: DUF721 domain-containing protein [candidate division Zixibacteria bacterium]|nr:DUF721 domain-containing protein [candidate division Zixibacteria bacterium]MBU1469060.1 DUF721 domain-containing protein [candidate division Zixibacteria bacterium]MBU2624636.1 DUF721 domain-containing protein [candidate division Zixibacteria bacterium]